MGAGDLPDRLLTTPLGGMGPGGIRARSGTVLADYGLHAEGVQMSKRHGHGNQGGQQIRRWRRNRLPYDRQPRSQAIHAIVSSRDSGSISARLIRTTPLGTPTKTMLNRQ